MVLGYRALANGYIDYIILQNTDVWMNIYFVPGTVLDGGITKSVKSSSLWLRCLDWHTHIELWGHATMGDAQSWARVPGEVLLELTFQEPIGASVLNDSFVD